MCLESGVAVAVVYRPAAAAPLQPLTWELPYAMTADLKRDKKKKKYMNIANFRDKGRTGSYR